MKIRTTFLIDDELYRQVKVLAAQKRRTVTSLIEETLRRMVGEPAGSTPEAEPLPFHTFASALVAPDLDLTSNAAIDDFIGREDDARFVEAMADRVHA